MWILLYKGFDPKSVFDGRSTRNIKYGDQVEFYIESLRDDQLAQFPALWEDFGIGGGGGGDIEIWISKFQVTADFAVDEVIDLTTGAGATGTCTLTGQAIDGTIFGLGANATEFYDNNGINVYIEGQGQKFKEVSAIYDSATSIHFPVPMQVGDYFWVQKGVLVGATPPAPGYQPPLVRKYEVTTAFPANDIIDITTGAGAVAGISTVTGKAITTLGAVVSEFIDNDERNIRLIGVGVLSKGSDVVWDSATTFHFISGLPIGERFQVIVEGSN